MIDLRHDGPYFFLGSLLGLALVTIYLTFFPPRSRLSLPISLRLETSLPSPLPTPAPTLTILFVGDVMLGRKVNQTIHELADPTWPFIQVGQTLRSSDLTYINLESPLITDCPVTPVGMKFCGSAQNVAGLVWAGVDIASLANNHATNYGSAGLEETQQILQNSGIAVTGIGSPTVVTKNNIPISFVSFDDVSRAISLDELTQQIGEARAVSDLVIATFHWGSEYQSTPNPRQINLAHTAIDAGADLVVGAHPHWVQTHELYQGKPIYYSLGNFVFDQEWSEETKTGLAVRFTYLNSELINTEELPVYIRNFGQPQWSDPQ
ncbi:MAG: hypothetical protein UX64_C0012G0002 [Microgenomates group bacterium GW2011_GWC2_46_7]|nr:MAG: hypothetical protein UX64_C0012G0002 [Microgenomates group bacterium GW2011_GWC2_46_7]